MIDPYVREKGQADRIADRSASFPGWDGFGALIKHMKFVYDHHRKIDRVAAVTDNAFLKIAPKIAEHFAHPESSLREWIRNALVWLQTGV